MHAISLPAQRTIFLASFILLSASTVCTARAQEGEFNFPARQERAQAGTPVLPPAPLPEDWVRALNWRCIGPANMGGRITAISVYEADPCIYWVATGGGGLLKTVNNGVTFEHQFDKEETVSVGDVCVAPSNPSIVWVGTGENNPRNSVSYGDGVHKSVDGGKTWTNMGLKKTFQIGKILVHPKNPEIVYVGALGRLYGPNEDRGVFKTTDGGATWEKVFYVDDKTGIIDMRFSPADPETIIIAAWDRERDGFDSYLGGSPPEGYDTYDPIRKWGKGAGLYKTVEGGKTWKRLTRGLPTNHIGRIGLDWYRKDPNTVFAIIDCEKIGMGAATKNAGSGNAYMGFFGEDAEDAVRIIGVTDGGPASKAGLQSGDIIQSVNDKPIKAYDEITSDLQSRSVGDKLKLKVMRDKMVQEFTVTLEARPAQGPGSGFGGPGGATKTRPYGANYGGQRENIQDQQGKDSFEYGGIYKSTDAGETWTRINSLNPRPMYFSLLRVDPNDDKYLYVGGVSLYRSSDGGKTFKPDGGRNVHADQHALWVNPRDGRNMLVGCDGGFYATYDRMNNWDHLNTTAIGQFYHVAISLKQPYWVFGGLQDNGSWGGPTIGLRGGGPINEDWVSAGGGDGFVCRVDKDDPDWIYYESQNGSIGRRNLRTGERGAIRPPQQRGQPAYRFNWNTPYILSAHNSRIFYCAGNYVFRSLNRGDNLITISPEISRSKRGSATALAESPRNPEVLWVGTDDGNLWITRNGGKDWSNVEKNVGLKAPSWVATIEPSHFVEGRAYVAFDCHRSNDEDPCVYVTEDFGKTWKSIRANLPMGSSRCLREDLENQNLLFCGTEFSLFASTDRGATWTKINNNLPTVAVHEVAIHPTAGEIVAATHGRSLWILDVSALRQVNAETLKDKPVLFKPKAVVRWQQDAGRGATNRRFIGENPPPGAQFFYSIPKKAEKVALKIVDIEGATVREFRGATETGLHTISWDLTRTPARTAGGPGPAGGQGPAGAGQGGQGRRRGAQPGGEPGAAGQGGAGQRVGGQGQRQGGAGGGQGQGGGGFGRFAAGRAVAPGAYRIVLTVDGQEYAQVVKVEPDPNNPAASLAANDDEEMPGEEEEEREGRVIRIN